MESLYPDALTRLFALVCGQNPAHVWMPGGMALPCCQRCLGLYVGAAAAMLLHSLLRPKMSGRFLEVHGLFLAIMIPLGFHWIEHGPVLRTVSGLAFGFAVATFLCLPFARETSTHPSTDTVRARAYWASMLLTTFLLPIAATQGGRIAGLLLGACALAGLLTLAALCLAVVFFAAKTGFHVLMHRVAQERGDSCRCAGAKTTTAPRP